MRKHLLSLTMLLSPTLVGFDFGLESGKVYKGASFKVWTYRQLALFILEQAAVQLEK